MSARRPTAPAEPEGRSARGTARTIAALAVLTALLLSPAAVRADTVYLKNGRVLRAARVTVTDDKVILEQSGNKVEFPRDLVERIERDGEASEVLEPRQEPATPAAPRAPAEAGDTGTGDAEAEAEDEGAEQEEEADPKQTREYWQGVMEDLETAREQLRETLEELRREERAFLFSRRSTAEVKAEIERVETELAELDAREQELRREARRLQVPPGWLRIDG